MSTPPPADDDRIVRLAAKREKARYARRMAELKEERKRAIREAVLLRRELDKARLYRYGAYSAGAEGWERRWDESPGRRVLFYANVDSAGSFFRWAEAVNRHTPYAVRVACFTLTPFHHPTDLVFPDPEVAASGFDELVAEADVIQVKDELGFPRAEGPGAGPVLASGKPVVFTHYGGRAREQASDPAYRRAVGRTAARVATTPDLCFDWFDGRWIPLPIDTERFAYGWGDGRVVGHSPSIPERKGTREFLAAAAPLECDVELIRDVSHSECLERKARCNLFFDQAGWELPRFGGRPVGIYANSGLEAAVRGIPTIAHLSEELFEGALRGGKDLRSDCLIINTPLGVEGIRATLRRWLEAPSEERDRHSRQTREWVQRLHSFRAVGEDLAAVYDDL